MKKSALIMACLAIAVGPAMAQTGKSLSILPTGPIGPLGLVGPSGTSKIIVTETCQFPDTPGTTTGLFGQWPACGDPGPLVSTSGSKCFFLTDVIIANNNPINNNTTDRLIVIEDGNHPGASSPPDYQLPFVVGLGTVSHTFNTPVKFKSGVWTYDRTPAYNHNVWVTVSGYYDSCSK